MDLIQQIKLDLLSNLSDYRYKHIEGVANTARLLAIDCGADPEKAELAGWLHDIAKEFKADQLISEAYRFEITIDEIERLSPHLLHAKVGAFIARERYFIEDKDVLNAIAQHTLGKPNMSLLEEILFIADSIEPSRPQKWSESIKSEMIGTNAFQRAILRICKNTINEVINRDHYLHPLTVQTYNYYLSKIIYAY